MLHLVSLLPEIIVLWLCCAVWKLLKLCICVVDSWTTWVWTARVYLCVCSVAQLCPTLWLHGMYPTRLLCPSDFPGKNTGVGFHFLLQGIFLTQGSNLHFLLLLHCQADSLPLCQLGSPLHMNFFSNKYYTSTDSWICRYNHVYGVVVVV